MLAACQRNHSFKRNRTRFHEKTGATLPNVKYSTSLKKKKNVLFAKHVRDGQVYINIVGSIIVYNKNHIPVCIYIYLYFIVLFVFFEHPHVVGGDKKTNHARYLDERLRLNKFAEYIYVKSTTTINCEFTFVFESIKTQ